MPIDARFPVPRDNRERTDTRHSAAEQTLIRVLDDLYDEGKKVRDRWAPEKDIEGDLKLYRGEVGPKDREPWFECNFIEMFTERMVSQVTDNRPIMRVEPRKAGLSNVALVLDKVVRAEWEAAEMQRQAFKMAHNAATTRSAGLYTGWDPISSQIVLETLKISQVVLDPAVCEAALAARGEYLFIDRVRPVSDLVHRFPGRGGAVKADAIVSESPIGAKKRGILSPLNELLSGKVSSPDALPRANVRECLVIDRQKGPDGKPLFPFGRVIIKTADLLLWDGPNYFWDGQFPVDWFDWAVDPEHPYGTSLPRSLMRMQLAFNQLGDGLVENQLLTNIIRLEYDYDALDDATVKKFKKLASSLVLQKRNRNAAVTVTPPQPFGADKIGLMRFIFQMAQLKTGVTDVTLGESPGSLQSGQAIEGLQEGANLMTRSRASRMEDFYKRVGQKLISRIFQFLPCTDPETECLTRSGWKRHTDVSEGDEIYTLNPQTEEGEWCQIERLNVYDYEGPMHYLSGSKIDALVTPNHRWPVVNINPRANGPARHRWKESSRRRWSEGVSRIAFVETRDLNQEMALPSRAPLAKSGEDETVPDHVVELVGWIVTEGWIRAEGGSPRIEVSQSATVNPAKCRAIRRSLEMNGIRWSESRQKTGVITFAWHGDPAVKFLALCPEKTLRYEFLAALSQRQLHLLMDTMIAGDGSRRTHWRGRKVHYTQYYSSDRKLADQFQMVATLAGYATRLYAIPRAPQYKTAWGVRVSDGAKSRCAHLRTPLKNSSIVPYRGIVWCPTTRNGTWLARRNGRVYVTGNSDRIVSMLGPTGKSIDYAIKRTEFFLRDDGTEMSQEERQQALRDLRFTVSPGSSAPGTRIRRTEMAMKLFVGGLIPGIDVLETAEYPDAEAKFKLAQEQSATRDPKMLNQLKQMLGRG